MRTGKINGQFREQRMNRNKTVTPVCTRNHLKHFASGKRSQEEMIGFVVIIVVISVILLVLLGFMLKNPEKAAVENYEIESFIQSSLQYTTECEEQAEFLSVEQLISACDEGSICDNGKDSCIVLNDSLKNLIDNGWNINKQSAVKGYKFGIIAGEQEKLALKKGNETENYKGGFQDFQRRGKDYIVSLNVYY